MVYNPYIVVPFATWAVAQISKFTLAALRGRIDFRYLYASGGMPSVHSAVVCSLATTSFLVDGSSSHIFGLVAILAAIVMYDSFGVRRSSGEQAGAINMLIQSLSTDRIRLTQPDLKLREILGHQPREVMAGAILGVVLGGAFNYERLGTFMNFIQVTPKGIELIAYGVVAGLVILGGILYRVILHARYPKSKTINNLTRSVITMTQTIGWLAVLATVLQYERDSYTAWRLWIILILLAGATWALTIFRQMHRTVPVAMALEANSARKMKWFGNDRKRRKGKKA